MKIWKRISGFDDIFMISSDGDIKNIRESEEGILLEKSFKNDKETVILNIEGGKKYTYFVETLMKRYFSENQNRTKWKEIQGFDGNYMISSSANVKSFRRSTEGILLKKGCFKDREYVTLSRDGNGYRYYIALLMKKYFPEENYKDFKSKF